MIIKPKGTNDILPSNVYVWHSLEDKIREITKRFNVKEMRTPIFEHTELFLRGVGDGTDIVNKEMYTFLDKGNRSITLKPEGTACVVRSFIENNLQNEVLPCKVYYVSPIFRYERPQAGRLRQHHQFGVELIGSKSARMDAEAINIANTFLQEIGIKNYLLNINSIGCETCRKNYIQALKDYYGDKLEELCEDCKVRFDKNTLRLLDCKNEKCSCIKDKAPSILDYLCEDCKSHFEELKKLLNDLQIKFVVNDKIVRGLDYYTKTVFEFISLEAGRDGVAICSGGRYDKLISNLGGGDVPSVGFGMGLERIILSLESENQKVENKERLDVYVIKIGLNDNDIDINLANTLRQNGISAEFDTMNRSVKNNFKYANKINAKYTLVVGEDELKTQTYKLKNMESGEEKTLTLEEILGELKYE